MANEAPWQRPSADAARRRGGNCQSRPNCNIVRTHRRRESSPHVGSLQQHLHASIVKDLVPQPGRTIEAGFRVAF